METLHALVSNFYALLSTNEVLLCIQIFALIVQCIIASHITTAFLHSRQHKFLLGCLLLISSMLFLQHFSWVIHLLDLLRVTPFSEELVRVIIRIAWIGSVFKYLGLNLFIANILRSEIEIKKYQKCMIAFYSSVIVYMMYLTISQYHALDITFFSNHFMKQIPLLLDLSLIPTFIGLYKQFKQTNIPKILKDQTKVLILTALFPEFIFNLLHQLTRTITDNFIDNTQFEAISTLLLIYGMYYGIKKIFRFTFLDITIPRFTVSYIKNESVLNESVARLKQAKTFTELKFITQNFFKEAFGIPFEDTILYIRHLPNQDLDSNTPYAIINAVIEKVLAQEKSFALQVFQRNQIIVHDEIEFDAFYNIRPHANFLYKILNDLNAELFIPIFKEDNSFVAYICISEQQGDFLFTKKDKNYISLFASYLSEYIDRLLKGDMDFLVLQNKQLKDELYFKHQEINQYKEGIHAVFKAKPKISTSLLFYRYNHFIPADEGVALFLGFDIQKDKNNPLIAQIKEFAEKIHQYKQSKRQFFTNTQGQKIIINGSPHAHQNDGVVLILEYPDSSDIIRSQIDKLKDPSTLDYVLYLETTKSGKLVNQLVPGYSQELLDFKIQLLKGALTKKAITLQLPSQDLETVTDIIHHISLREQLHILDLQTHSTSEIALKLFGIETIFSDNNQMGLLNTLNKKGTLFIRNIEYLDHEIQNKLALYLKYGTFTPLGSEHTYRTDVRIICSINQDLQTLLSAKTITQHLFVELEQMHLTLPSLLNLEHQDSYELIDGFSTQIIQGTKNIAPTVLQQHEKDFILERKPTSLHEFKQYIQQLFSQKITIVAQQGVKKEIHLDPVFDVTDQEVARAMTLGKDSLKDQKLVAYLWKK
ncbi:hypothetical protein EBQ93_00100, partial [bacterium]|nr:hypothetical protein [bacterium]